MINAARTLLLNRADSEVPGVPGRELIDADFVPRQWTEHMLRIRRELYGSNPDALYESWRTAQYMKILHSTPFSDHVTALDARISYDPFSDSLFRMPESGTADRISGSNELVLLGTARADDARGQADHFYTVTTDGSSCTIRTSTVVRTLQISGWIDYSPVILLTPGRSFRILGAPGSGSWSIHDRTRPGRSLSDVCLKLRIQREHVNELTQRQAGEPWQTFRNLWDAPDPTLQLAGLLLALIYRANML